MLMILCWSVGVYACAKLEAWKRSVERSKGTYTHVCNCKQGNHPCICRG